MAYIHRIMANDVAGYARLIIQEFAENAFIFKGVALGLSAFAGSLLLPAIPTG